MSSSINKSRDLIALMPTIQAHAMGEVIEFNAGGVTGWGEIKDPSWSAPAVKYRIGPKVVEVKRYVVIHKPFRVEEGMYRDLSMAEDYVNRQPDSRQLTIVLLEGEYTQ